RASPTACPWRRWWRRCWRGPPTSRPAPWSGRAGARAAGGPAEGSDGAPLRRTRLGRAPTAVAAAGRDPASGQPEERRHPLPAAHAHRDDAVLGLAPVHLGEEVGGDARAGGAERVADGDGATVDVELLVGDAQLALAVVRLAGERLVDLDQVHVR